MSASQDALEVGGFAADKDGAGPREFCGPFAVRLGPSADGGRTAAPPRVDGPGTGGSDMDSGQAGSMSAPPVGAGSRRARALWGT